MWTDEARQASAEARARAQGHSPKGAVGVAAISNFQSAAAKWAQGILDARDQLAAHQARTDVKLKSTAEMMAEHDRIWGRK